MKMSTLRDQSAPVLYGLVVLFILAMGGFSRIFSSTNPSTGNNENCDPERFIACSDNGEISITVEDYYRRYYNSIDFFHSRANPFGPNSPYSATDQQLDTINALNQVWPVMINEKIMSKFISDLDLLSNNNTNEEIIKFIKNYPNFNSTYKTELELYGIFTVDSVFSQVLYEKAVDEGIVDDKINEYFSLNFPQQDIQLKRVGTTRWNNWFSTMKRQIANIKLNYFINSTYSLSNLELKDQFMLEKGEFDFDYITLSLSTINDIEVTDEEIETYYLEIREDENYNLKKSDRRVLEFAKWNTTNLNDEEKDSVNKLVKEFRKHARKYGFDDAIEKNNTFSLAKEITLSNDFSLNGSGLGTQTLNTDSTRTPFYNILGAGRKIINFSFSNDIGDIKLIRIDSDRKNDKGFNDIGVFYIKEEINEGYLTIEEAGIKERLKKEMLYQKKYALGKEKLNQLLTDYKESENNVEGEDQDIDFFYYFFSGDENILFQSHKGTINDFIQSFINTDLRNTILSSEELKASILSLEKGVNYTITAIDNETIIAFRLNTKPDLDLLDLDNYRKTELERLANTQSSLFLEDQKETANIKDNRTLVY